MKFKDIYISVSNLFHSQSGSEVCISTVGAENNMEGRGEGDSEQVKGQNRVKRLLDIFLYPDNSHFVINQ